MGGSASELTGPDLGAGIDAKALGDGAMLQGHASGEAVLLVRRGLEVFAVGAHCTHYGAPLVDGLLVDGTVRCPWHHACFDLMSGEAVAAPALDGLQCWNVEEQAGQLRVTGKARAEMRTVRERRTQHPSSVVIVGGGAAAAAAVEMLRRDAYVGRITVISAESTAPVDRPNLSKDYLAGTAPEEWMQLRPTSFYEEDRVTFLLDSRATGLDTAARKITLEGGRTVDYGVLLLATGAQPVRLAIPGADSPKVHTLRTLADSRRIITAAATAKRAVVIGSSFIGLEVAASLRARGLEVHLVGREARPLAKVLGDEIGDFVRALHEEHGVVFHLGKTPTAIGADGAVTLDGGATLPADLVVMGVGVRPSLELAEAGGLMVDRGVAVNEYLETSAAGVFAAGDVARYPDKQSGQHVRVEHWVVAERQGQVAAKNMIGKRVPFSSVPFFWSAHYDVTIGYVGHAAAWDKAELHGSPAARSCTVAYRQGGKILAVATIGRDRVSLEAEAAFERGDQAALESIVAR